MLLSLCYPGVGQFYQGRILVALLFIIISTAFVFRLIFLTMWPVVYNIRVALEFASGTGDDPLMEPRILAILTTFCIIMAIYVSGIVDTHLANRRALAHRRPRFEGSS